LLAEMAAMNKRSSQQDRAISITAQENSFDTTQHAAVAAPSGTDLELVKVRKEYAVEEERLRALQEQLRAAAFELQASRAQLEEAGGSRNQLENKLAEADEALARVNDELQGLRDSRSKDAASIAAQDSEIRQLSTRLNEQTESLEREQTLLAAGRDIHDLMGARNLHVVDVLDVDSKGKDKRAFGRVFYTEEKSLIFYAYDLGDRATAKRNASFQVWGARGPAQNPAQSLGVFYVDDQKQNRWVLKFDDPSILAEIDSVFVTVEPPGGSAKPTGQKLLYAYLKANANHP
jgi:hypothetical protein